MMKEIGYAARNVAHELLKASDLKAGQIVVVGCSTSEIIGQNVGTGSSPEIGVVVFQQMFEVFSELGIFIAAQCCEHLNRALVVNVKTASDLEIVSVIPVSNAGGSFAAAAYEHMNEAVVVEEIKADAGIDIGSTLIGMHLKRVAVPLRLTTKFIGEANVVAARTRPKLIGGARAVYNVF